MSENIAVSVICTVYNHERYVRDALEGFVMQRTNFTFEVLVHDDASTDHTADIVREYEQKYPELIKPIYQTENQYSKHDGTIRRILQARAKGKYIALCEGDDYWTDPLKLQKQYDFMEQNPGYSMCTCSVAWIDMQTNRIVNLCRTDCDKDISLEDIILETKGRIFQTASFFLKKDMYCSTPEWTSHFGVGDTPLAMYLALHGKIRMLADCMAVYRNHTVGSWTLRIENDTVYKAASFQRMIEGFEAFDMATQYQYHDVVSVRIKRLKYNISRVNRDLSALRSSELREIYKAKKFKARVGDMLYCKAPVLYRCLRRIVG